MKTKIKLIIAEDHPIVRKSLKFYIESKKEFEIIAEASNGKELIDILKTKSADIILMDVQMPVMNGIEAMEIINKRFPGQKVIILSLHDEYTFILDILTKGANGFVSKNAESEVLFTAIKEVYSNGRYFDKTISEAMYNGLLKEKSINPLFDQQALSERETQIMKEICNGNSNKNISKKLNIATCTVDFHKRNIYKKTKSKCAVELLKYAIKHQLIEIN